jgi:hypothetical protein
MKIAIAVTLVLCALGLFALRRLQRELDQLQQTEALSTAHTGESRTTQVPKPGIESPSEFRSGQPSGVASELKAKDAAMDPAELARVREQQAALNQKVARGRLLEAINRAYGPLIQRLNLNPDTAAQFASLVSQERLTAGEAIQAEKAQGVTSVADYLAAVREAVGGVDQQLSTLLGADNFEAFTQYRSTLPEQVTVAQLSDQLSSTSAPLTQGEQAQLVLLLDQMEVPSFRLNEDFLGIVGMQVAPLSDPMVQAAGQILSPPQAEALRTLQQAQQARTAIENQLRTTTP